MATLAETFRQAFAAFQRGDLASAERGFRQVLRKEPKNLGALNLLAVLLTSTQRFEEAERFFIAALRLDTRSDATFYNYGLVLKSLGRLDEAVERFSQALALNPRNGESWNNRGTVLTLLKAHGRAIADFDQALALNPKDAGAIFNKGKALAELKRHDEARAAYEAALALRPDMAEAWYGLGVLESGLKRHAAAVTAFARAHVLNPALPFLKGSLLHQKMLICDWHGVAELIAEIEADLAAGRPSAEPFGWQGVATSSSSLQRCAELFSRQLFPSNFTALPRPAPGPRLRIGYVSGEFREQATSLLMVGVLEQHDRNRFEIVAFDNGWDDGSATRRRIAAAVDRIVPIREVSDVEATAAIREAGIDVLVDLNGYFGEARTRVFARRAAPVQVNYLGFPGTLGATYMDYIIADGEVLPIEDHRFFAEKVVTLPHCYQPNDRQRPIATSEVTRQGCGLPEKGFVFCCFNNSYKITPEIFTSWLRILRQVEDSVLWLIEDSTEATANLRRAAEAAGIAAARIVFAGRLPPAEHLARHRCADLFLDTLPYNAHTTASDALWTGLPLLTCRGATFAGRVAASLLKAIELPELVTTSLADYEATAVALARDPARLAALREQLAANRLSTPLFDTAAITRSLEAAYGTMIERHRAGLSPAAFTVPA